MAEPHAINPFGAAEPWADAPAAEDEAGTENTTTLNTPAVRQAIVKDFETIRELQAERKSIGMSENEVWKKFKDRGIDKKSAKEAYRLWCLSEEKRQEYAIGLDICLQATEISQDLVRFLKLPAAD